MARVAWVWYSALLPAFRANGRALGLSGAAAACGAALAYADIDGVRGYAIAQLEFNTGALEQGAGNLESGLFHLRRGVALDPGDPTGQVQLAGALEQAGRLAEAEAVLREALARLPGDLALRQATARFLRRHRGRGTAE